jgi:MFS family permease
MDTSSGSAADNGSGAGAPKRRLFPALRNRFFAAYAASCTFAFVALWIQRTTIGWLTWQLTGSGLWLGLVSFAYLLPLILLGPVGGAVADRRNPLQVIFAGQTVLALAALSLLILSATDKVTVELLLAITAVQGIAETFSQTSQLAIVPSLVDRKDMTAGFATMAVAFNTARFAGPAVAGALIAGPGIEAAFAASAIGFSLFLATLVVLRSRARTAPSKRQGTFFAALREGARYTATHPGIGPMMILIVFVGAAGRPVAELLPGFAGAVFESGPIGLAVLTSSIGAGAILAGLRWSGIGSRVDGLTRVILRSTLLLAAVLVAFVGAPNLYVAAALLVGAGYFSASVGISAQTLISIAVDETMRGRVLSLFGVCFRGSPAIGAVVMGAASEAYGLRIPVFAGAVLLFVCWLWFKRRSTRLAFELEKGG